MMVRQVLTEKRDRRENVVMRVCVVGREILWTVFRELQVCQVNREKRERLEETVYRVFRDRRVRRERSVVDV